MLDSQDNADQAVTPIMYGATRRTCAGLPIPQLRQCCVGNPVLLLQDPVCARYLDEESQRIYGVEQRPVIVLDGYAG